jgi:hypothetical protein
MKIKLGTKVTVSDPCYEIPTWCQAVINNVLPGDYICEVKMINDFPGELCVYHPKSNMLWELTDYDIGVDSGQCGVFDFDSYRNDEIVPDMNNVENEKGEKWDYPNKEKGDKWYEKICEYTLFTKDSHGGYSSGYVSRSGYGDSNYGLSVTKNKESEVDGFKIQFIFDIDDEDWEPENEIN